jgi:hypothetical protein
MCIFAGPVERVSNTKIFVAAAGGRQYTAYEMQFEMPPLKREHILAGTNPPGNAMILPVPWNAGEEITLVDMSKTPRFFNDLNDLLEPRTRGYKGFESFGAPAGGFLKVQEVGNFDVSIAYTVEDIDRVDPTAFTLSPSAKATLEKHYPDGYAFVVCALARDGSIHPLAYTSAARSTLFVPTRHEHGDSDEFPEWDHSIFTTTKSQPFQNAHGKQEATSMSSRMWQTVAGSVTELMPFVEHGPWLVRHVYRGKLPNKDIRIPV